MSRRRRISTNVRSTNVRKGVQTPALRTEKRADGSTYKFWNLQFPIENWTHVDGDVWDIETKYVQVRGTSRQECEDKAAALEAAHVAYVKYVRALGRQPITFKEWRRNYTPGLPEGVTEDVVKIDAPTPLPAPQSASKTLDVVAEEYMSTKGRYDRSGNFVPLSNSYVTRGKVYIRSFGTLLSKDMDQLTRLDVDTWFSQYQQLHSQNTAYRFRAWLVPVGDYAVEMSYWSKNHFKALPKISAQRQDDKPTLSFDDIDGLWIEAADDPVLAALFVLLRFGLRIGEVLGLTADCINDDGSIHIKYNLTDTPNDGTIKSKSKMLPYLGTTKTRASTSKIHIPKHWIPILRKSLEKSKPMLIQAHDDKKFGLRSHNFVINNKFGQCWRDENVKRAVQKLMQRAQVTIDDSDHSLAHTPIFHIWRYTYCSELVALGANDVEIMSLMRHTDSNLSKEVYAQVRLEDKQLYDHYHKQVKSTHGYNLVIAQMDEDRRAGIEPLAVKPVSAPVPAPTTFFIKPGTPMPSLPKLKKGLGGVIGTDGSLKVDI
jgi:integrase